MTSSAARRARPTKAPSSADQVRSARVVTRWTRLASQVTRQTRITTTMINKAKISEVLILGSQSVSQALRKGRLDRWQGRWSPHSTRNKLLS